MLRHKHVQVTNMVDECMICKEDTAYRLEKRPQSTEGTDKVEREETREEK